jgi:hypothetical protein
MGVFESGQEPGEPRRGVVDRAGRPVPLDRPGWTHFRGLGSSDTSIDCESITECLYTRNTYARRCFDVGVVHEAAP